VTRQKYTAGDLVTVGLNRKFPVVLRSGPGYTFERVEPIEPGEIGVILDTCTGHGMITWLRLLISPDGNEGWTPEGGVEILVISKNDILDQLDVSSSVFKQT
jgi:hypothetical protein